MRALSIYGAGAPFDITAAADAAAVSICSACAELDILPAELSAGNKNICQKQSGRGSPVFETARDESRVAR